MTIFHRILSEDQAQWRHTNKWQLKHLRLIPLRRESRHLYLNVSNSQEICRNGVPSADCFQSHKKKTILIQ